MRGVIFFFSLIIGQFALGQPIPEDGNYTNLKLGIIYNSDTLNFVQHVDNSVRSSDGKFYVNFLEIRRDAEIDYDDQAGARNVGYIEKYGLYPYFHVRYESYNDSVPKALKLLLRREEERMTVYFRIKKKYHRPYVPIFLTMFIPFSEGTYEITNPDIPTLRDIAD